MTPIDGYAALTAAAGAWTTTALGQFEISGRDAVGLVDRVTTADMERLPPGRFAHSLILRDDATILSRVTIYRFADRVMLLVDVGARDAVWQQLLAHKRGDVRMRDISDDLGVIAIRGPMTISQLTLRLSPMPAASGDLTRSRLAGVDVFAARTTAEGPDGIDLYARSRDMDTILACLAEVATPMVQDGEWELFRMEFGVARAGVEIEEGDTPVEAALERLVELDKSTRFPGRVALEERIRTGAVRRLVGFVASSDTAPPPGAVVFVNGRMVDRVRSSVISPRFGPIGMTAVPLGADQPGTVLTITDGGKTWPAVVARVPFGREA